jgi:hypothetical protein
MDTFDEEKALLEAFDARIKRLEATRDVAIALGVDLHQIAADIAVCKELRERSIRNWSKRARPTR